MKTLFVKVVLFVNQCRSVSILQVLLSLQILSILVSGISHFKVQRAIALFLSIERKKNPNTLVNASHMEHTDEYRKTIPSTYFSRTAGVKRMCSGH